MFSALKEITWPFMAGHHVSKASSFLFITICPLNVYFLKVLSRQISFYIWFFILSLAITLFAIYAYDPHQN